MHYRLCFVLLFNLLISIYMDLFQKKKSKQKLNDECAEKNYRLRRAHEKGLE